MSLSMHKGVKDRRYNILETLEGYEGDAKTLTVKLPLVLYDTLERFAVSHASPQITKAKIIQFALVKLFEHEKLNTRS